MVITPGIAAGTSYPCEFETTSQTVYATYDGQQRNNPDGTYYPGDAFNYVANYPGLRSCFQPVVHEPVYSDDLIMDGHTYEDDYSIKAFKDFANSYCRFSYCTLGHAEIDAAARIGSKSMKFSAGGWRVICESQNVEICKYIWISKTSFLFVNVTDPKLIFHMEKKFMNDSDGYNATNMDGTHYMWDPIIVHSVPLYNWKNERNKTLFVEYDKNVKLHMEVNKTCDNTRCLLNFILPGFLPTTYNSTYGQDITIYNATDQHMLGSHDILHKVKLQSVSGEDIAVKDSKITVLAVTYKPVFKTYPYLVLSDKKSASWDNRHGVAMFYSGSNGSGPDDELIVHSDRRSKINNFSSIITAIKVDNIVPVNTKMIWSEAYGANHKDLGYCTKTQFDLNVLESRSPKTAMFVRSGYGSLIFDLPISNIMKDPLYSHALVNANIISNNFAGNYTKEIFNYEYTYPDILFGNNISLVTINSNGQILEDVPVSIDVMPNFGMNGVSYTHDYVCDKVEFDTGLREIGNILVNDMYPKKAQADAFGKVILYLPRISTWNAPYLDDFFSMPINEGYNAPSPYIIHLSVGEKNIVDTLLYSHIGDHAYIANQETHNILHIDDNRASIIIKGPDGFGHIQHIKLDGVDHPRLVNCLNSCILSTPKNAVLIEAYNIWGGRAYALYEPIIIKEGDQQFSNLYTLLIIITGVIITWRIIRMYHNSLKL
ncbi:MAG: hypothetical protein K8823_172 [Cenarchaeum symbiont of Oopsacas minuta]|nr:hypothetical protein [Cenarchaeum symbiont of Oopsacas minuta]